MRSGFRLPIVVRSSVVRRFADGLPLGLGAACLFFGGLLPRPSFERHGTDADWDSVGDDLNSAMASHGGDDLNSAMASHGGYAD